MLKIYWKIELLTKDDEHFPCFSPKFYGSFKDCKKWHFNTTFIDGLIKENKIRKRITLEVEK